ncbi:hypothetical protein [Paenibacillus sp. 1P07SE]|uniref:hypothetical protein n=1 Tax=Paenibacillus sp. 1P07SE TaxID=3132209 RepID=UPI0039A4DFA7
MSIKKWISFGLVYVVIVVAGYSIVTGLNPLASGELDHDGHAAPNRLEEEEERDHHAHNQQGHGHHHGESDVEVDVTYNDQKVIISVRGVKSTCL